MEITIKLNDDMIQMLEEWRTELLDQHRKDLEKEPVGNLRNAKISVYRRIKSAGIDVIANEFMSYQLIEWRWKDGIPKS